MPFPEYLQIILVQFEHQTKTLYLCEFILPNNHELYSPVSEINAQVLSTRHDNDVPCLPSTARYSTSSMFRIPIFDIHNGEFEPTA